MRVMNSTGWGLLVMWAILILLFIMTLTACHNPEEQVHKQSGLLEGDIHCITTSSNEYSRSWMCQHSPSGRTFTCGSNGSMGKVSCIEGTVKLGGYL